MAGMDVGKDWFPVSRFDDLPDVAPWSTEGTVAGTIAESPVSAPLAPAVDSSVPKMAKMRAVRSFVEGVWPMTPFKVPLLSFSATSR